MKTHITLLVLGLASNAFASTNYIDCKPSEKDKDCIQRVVKASDVMSQNFYTGKPSERSMIFNAIYDDKPTLITLQKTGEGGSIFTEYLLVYKVNPSTYSGLKAATFTATLETSLEDTGSKPKVVKRSVDVQSIKILTGATSESEE